MDPFIGRQRRRTAHFNRIAGPHVMQPHRYLAFFEDQLVTTAPGIHPGAAMMQHDQARRVRRSLQPEAKGEGIRPGEMPEAGKTETILSIQQGRLAELPWNKLERVGYEGGFRRIGSVSNFV